MLREGDDATGDLEAGVARMVLMDGVQLFLFQAEDGIRDYKVTGVQTCALPISEEKTERAGGDHGMLHGVRRIAGVRGVLSGGRLHVLGAGRGSSAVWAHSGGPDFVHRSEERRVGKECRSRWSPYH